MREHVLKKAPEAGLIELAVVKRSWHYGQKSSYHHATFCAGLVRLGDGRPHEHVRRGVGTVRDRFAA
jgi:hypothetical protein